jgi:GT2 family glycosyltransferase
LQALWRPRNRDWAHALDSLDTLMESLAPPVVIVIVTHDPGPWFETTLRAMDEQSYPETSVLVLDAASSEDPTPRVASILPEAFVRRLASNEGFGASANEAAAMVEGADFLLFCHDDVAPEPEALRHMVEEAYRSNAGVVGPKFVDWDAPERILHVGVQVDKSGAVVDRVERGEVDDGQHDAVRDVFSTPGGFTLIRSDLFSELGGFDPHIVVMGEDLDLCWRAQIAGARVIVAPDARVRHLELLASGKRSAPASVESAESAGESPGESPSESPSESPNESQGARRSKRTERPVSMQELQRRAELHAALKAYGPVHRARVVPQIALLAVAEMLVLSVVGRADRAREVAGAWVWNFRLRRETRAERRQLKSIRRVTDSDVRLAQIRGSARVSKYLRLAFTQGLHAAHLGLDDPVAGPISVRAARNARGERRSFHRPTPKVIAWIVMLLVVLLGVRQLLSGGLPVLGQFLRIPSPGSLVSQFASGHHQFGSTQAETATPATLILGLGGYLLFGSVSFLQTLLVVACLPLGAIGAARLCRSFSGGWAPVVGAACYLAVPLPYDDIATGRLDALFAYAAVPWIVLALAKASGLEPHRWHRDVEAAPTADPSRLVLGAVTLGIGEAVLVVFDPPAAFVTLLLGVGLSLGILVTAGRDSVKAAGRVMATTIGALGVTIVLLAPWSISVLAGNSPLDVLAGTRPGQFTNVGWGALLRMAPGPIGGTPLVWGLLVAAALPLFIGRQWRLSWAGRMWICALAAWVMALSAQRGWTGSASVLPAQFLPIAACGLALSTALGVTAFTLDLPASRFGWRQVVSALAGCAAVIGALPAIAASGGGRFDLPDTGFAQVLSWMSSVPSAGKSGVVWLGEGAVVPGRAWPVTTSLGYSVYAGGIPDLSSLWQGPPSSGNRQVAADIELASAGRTVELGQLLAAHSIRYVVVVTALVPDVPGLQQPSAAPPPAALLTSLDAQSDLRQLPTQGGYYVFDNPEFTAPSTPATVRAPTSNGIAITGEIILWVAVCTVLVMLRRRRRVHDIPPEGHGEHHSVRGSRAPGSPGSHWERGLWGQDATDARQGSESSVGTRSRGRNGGKDHVRRRATRRVVHTVVGSPGPRPDESAK